MARVLVVHADPREATRIRDVLVGEGHTVLPLATCGEEALELAVHERADLLLMDAGLPGSFDAIDLGWLLVQRLRLPLVLLAERADPEMLRRIASSEAQAFLLAPWVDVELKTTVALALARHQANSTVEESEYRFRQLAESLDALVYILDFRCARLLYVSPAYDALYGRPARNLAENPLDWLEAVHPEDRSRVESGVFQGLLQGRPGEAVYRVEHPDGRMLWLRSRNFLMREFGRPAWRVAGVVQDITPLKEAEERAAEAAARSSRRYEHLLGNITDAVWTLHQSGRLLFLSDRGRDLCGLASGTEQPLAALAHPEDRPRVEAALLRMFEHGDSYSEEFRLRRSDGTWRIVHDRATRTYLAEEGLCADGLCTDITERADLEARLRQFQKLEALGRLAGGVAHDFNNQLAVIQGFGELLLERSDPSDPRHESLLEIVAAARRGAGLTRQLLAFSRGHVVEARPVELNDLVSSLERFLERLLGETVRLETRLAAEVGSVLADPTQLEQVLVNLAINARDAMPDGGTLRLETQVPEEHPGFRRLVVEDDGSGIPEEDLGRIFDPFFTTKPVGQGTGLGLASVYGIIRKLGGEVEVSSREGEGTRFEILLPRSQEGVWDQAAEPREEPRAGGPPCRVLLVEDEPSVRHFVGQTLRLSGYEVVEASDAEEALRIYLEGIEVDLLLTDTVMPGMSGPRLAQELTSLQPSLRCLYMSGYSEGETLCHGLEQDRVVFLQKPFGPVELLAKVREALAVRVGS